MNNIGLHAATMKYGTGTNEIQSLVGSGRVVPRYPYLYLSYLFNRKQRAMAGTYELLLVLTMVQVQVHSTHTVLVLHCTWSVGMSKCAINYQP
jgi:hypothetical protein